MSRLYRAGVLILALSGCALLTPAKVEVRKEVLSQVPTGVPQRQTGPATVLVFPPEAAAALESTRMAYTTGAHGLGVFRDHEWAQPPAQMLHPLLVRTLEDTHAFHAVLAPPHAGATTYALHSEVLELVQDFSTKPATARLSLRVRLDDGASERVLATREFTRAVALRGENAQAGAAAANAAAAGLLRDVAQFVLDRTE